MTFTGWRFLGSAIATLPGQIHGLSTYDLGRRFNDSCLLELDKNYSRDRLDARKEHRVGAQRDALLFTIAGNTGQVSDAINGCDMHRSDWHPTSAPLHRKTNVCLSIANLNEVVNLHLLPYPPSKL